MSSIQFPRDVDAPQRIFIWRADTFVPLAVLFGAGLLSGHLVKCVIVGLVLSIAYRRFTDSRPDGFLLHWLYWHGLVPLKGRPALNPFLRRIYPL